MPLHFRRSIRILSFLRLNIGKRGVSTSIGVRGAHITVGHGQVRETVGLPGTGLSYTNVEGHQEARSAAQAAETPTRGVGYWIGVALFAVAIAAVIYLTYRGQR